MKRLKFAPELVAKVLSGKKFSTWRINDDKNIQKGDVISLCHVNGEEFAKAEIIKVKETIFENLTEEDWKGHEKFKSEKEMYETYSEYYNTKVTPKTKLKIIKFGLFK